MKIIALFLLLVISSSADFTREREPKSMILFGCSKGETQSKPAQKNSQLINKLFK